MLVHTKEIAGTLREETSSKFQAETNHISVGAQYNKMDKYMDNDFFDISEKNELLTLCTKKEVIPFQWDAAEYHKYPSKFSKLDFFYYQHQA